MSPSSSPDPALAPGPSPSRLPAHVDADGLPVSPSALGADTRARLSALGLGGGDWTAVGSDPVRDGRFRQAIVTLLLAGLGVPLVGVLVLHLTGVPAH